MARRVWLFDEVKYTVADIVCAPQSIRRPASNDQARNEERKSGLTQISQKDGLSERDEAYI